MFSSPNALAHPKAIIFGCAGPRLGADERAFFRDADPLGFILFRRNIENPNQVRDLVGELRESVGRSDAPVLIDQEGGRVARLGAPHWPVLPPARAIGLLAERDREAGLRAARTAARCIGGMLGPLGIDVACAPVVDLLLPETHAVIGDRAYSADPELTGVLAAAAVSGLLSVGITPIVKHIPGHGRATADSHLALPRIDSSRAVLESTDFLAFREVSDAPWAMVAHCVYTAIDAERAASISPTVIDDAIRESIGFGGVLIADDIGMKALDGPLARHAEATLAAGCDLTLHCSGNFAEMQSIAPAVGALSDASTTRLAAAVRLRASATAFDLADDLAELEQLLAL